MKSLGHFSGKMNRKLLAQLVQQVVGKMYVQKNQRREKMVIVTFIQSLLLRELKTSEPTFVKSTPINRSDKVLFVLV